MKTTFLLLITFISVSCFSQTITKPKIYKGEIFISELSNGVIYFSYQNPNYKTIIDIVSFSTTNKDSAIFLMSEAIRVLEMEKTARNQHIEHKVNGVFLKRYSFWQTRICLSDGNNPDFTASKKQLLKYKKALEEYTYSYQKKSN